MDGVAAWKDAGLPDGVEQVLYTNWAILLHAVLHADMIVLQGTQDAQSLQIHRWAEPFLLYN